jgi:O-antigen ligase
MQKYHQTGDGNAFRSPALGFLEKCQVAITVLLLAGNVWIWSGLRTAWLIPGVAVAAVLLALVLVSPLVGVACGRTAGVFRSGRGWWGDPVFYLGLLFLAYLAVQWWNAGRVLFFDVGLKRWCYSPPRHPGLPFAFNRGEAMQMLYWFFPAWVLALSVRSPVIGRRVLRGVIRFVVYNAGGVALFGIVQFAMGTKSMYGRVPVDHDFFASFGYTNHAAAYFVMIGAVSAGLVFREVFRRDRPMDRVHAGLMGVVLVLCLTAANLSLSRAGVILSWTLAFFVAVYGLARGWREMRWSGRVKLMTLTGAVVIVLYFAVSGFGNAAIRREFAIKRSPMHQMIPSLAGVNLDLTVRPLLWQTAWSVYKTHALYGVGGWGFRYLAAFHMPSEQWSELDHHRGRANVHNDPLQFLAEFGLVGMGLMVATLGTLAIPLFRHGQAHGAVFTMTCAGLSLVIIFSLIDLPFRCPAILWTWLTLLATLPRLSAYSGAEYRSTYRSLNRAVDLNENSTTPINDVSANPCHSF